MEENTTKEVQRYHKTPLKNARDLKKRMQSINQMSSPKAALQEIAILRTELTQVDHGAQIKNGDTSIRTNRSQANDKAEASFANHLINNNSQIKKSLQTLERSIIDAALGLKQR